MSSEQKKPVVLILADGFGLSSNLSGNAVAMAKPVNFLRLWQNYQHLLLEMKPSHNPYESYADLATGEKCLEQTDNLSHDALNSNNELLSCIDSLKRNNAAMHVIAVLAKTEIDDCLENIRVLLRFAKNNSAFSAFIHIIIDDSINDLATISHFIDKLESELEKINFGHIATISGQNKLLVRNNFKSFFEVLYAGKGKTALSAKQALANTRGLSLADLEPTIIKSRQNQKINSFDLLFFATELKGKFADLVGKIVVANSAGLSSGLDFLKFFAISSSPVSFKDSIKYIFEQKSENNISSILKLSNKSHIIVTDQTNLPKLSHYFLGDGKAADQKVVEDRLDAISKKVLSSTEAIARETLALIEANNHDLITVNFSSLYRYCTKGSFGECVAEVKKIDDSLVKIVEAVLEQDGYVLFCPTFGGAESIPLKFTPLPSSALPFIVISEQTKSQSKKDIFSEMLSPKADLTRVTEALKIILLMD